MARPTPIEFAHQLKLARLEKRTLIPLSSRTELTREWAIAVQQADRHERVNAGEHVIGAKLGLTSLVKQRAMNIKEPVFGFLTDAMMAHGEILLDNFHQPRIEPELVFKTSRAITTPIALEDAQNYIGAVAPGFEIIDSRYPDFTFTYVDVIADNSSAAAFGVGEWVDFSGENLIDYQGFIAQDGISQGIGALSELLGNPLQTLVSLSHHLHATDQELPADSIVLAGSMTNAIPVVAGHTYRVGINFLGYVDIEVK